jgi:uncharacterized protein YajQ (UPF0234 family)
MIDMASESSFDIVSKIDMQEVDNAINQAMREMETRFDFKGSKSNIEVEKEELLLTSDDEFRLKSVVDILEGKLFKRGISLRGLDFGKIESATGGTVRQRVKLKQGVDQENAKKIHALIRDSKVKVKAQTQGDQIRVSGKSRDDLQQIMNLVKQADLTIDVQFVNYR